MGKCSYFFDIVREGHKLSNRKPVAVRVVVRVAAQFLLPLLLLPPALSACGSASSPFVTTVGKLERGSTLAVQLDSGRVDAYQPVRGQRPDLFTISATALPKTTPPPPRLHAAPLGVVVRATGALASLLVRVPDGVNLLVESQRGDVNVTDITGNARVVAQHGNVDIKVPGYAQATVGDGNLSVMMGAASWPGTLAFSTRRGDVELWIVGRAAFSVHLHTDDGTLFTDFGLRGVSSGRAETIDGSVNGGTAQRIDVETATGSIRLLRLQPQP
jgi:putative adhesin